MPFRLLATTPEANLARLPIALDLRAVSLAEGARAALSIAAIVAASGWLQQPVLLEAALGALLICLCDAGGPFRRRLPALLAFTLFGFLIIVGYGLLRAAGLWVVIPAACAGVFACLMARVWGQSQMQVGNLLVVVLVLSLDERATLDAALLRGSLFAAGCLWATLLTMVLWRIYPFRPVRRAISDAYRAIARLVGDLRGLLEADTGTEAWDAHARGHRRAVRDAVERARTAVQDTLRVRGQASPRAAQGLIRIEAADQLFGALIALSDLLEAEHDPVLRQAADRLLRLLRPLIVVVAEAIAADDPGLGGKLRRPVGRLARIAPVMAEITAAGARHPALQPLADAMLVRLRAAVSLTLPGGTVPGSVDAKPSPRWQRVFGPVRSNLDWQSAVLRHAVRGATLAAPALLATLPFAGRFQHWLTITLVLTLQPFYATTWQRALERIGGTALGGLLAALIALVCTTPLSIAAALFPLAVLTFAVRGVNYGAFILLLTPLVVLLTEFSRPGTGELLIAGERALYTFAGGALAVVGGLVLWPSWEPDRLRQTLQEALAAHAAFAEAELAALLQQAPAAAVHAARRSAGLASNNLETTIARALTEPRRGARQGLQEAMVVDAALRRMAARLSALQIDPHHADGLPPDGLRAWRDWIAASFSALKERRALPGRQPAGKAPDALARIALQIELLDGALRRDAAAGG